MNFDGGFFEEQLTLSASGTALHYTVDRTIADNSRLIYIPEAGQQAILVFNYGAQDRDKNNSFTSTVSDVSLRMTYTFRY